MDSGFNTRVYILPTPNLTLFSAKLKSHRYEAFYDRNYQIFPPLNTVVGIFWSFTADLSKSAVNK